MDEILAAGSMLRILIAEVSSNDSAEFDLFFRRSLRKKRPAPYDSPATIRQPAASTMIGI